MAEYVGKEQLIEKGHPIIDVGTGTGTAGVTVKEIGEIPAADVVEVVRCKDCKHRPIYDESSFLGPILAPEIDVGTDVEQDYTCPYLCSDPFYSAIPLDDFYCAKGERKSEM